MSFIDGVDNDLLVSVIMTPEGCQKVLQVVSGNGHHTKNGTILKSIIKKLDF